MPRHLRQPSSRDLSVVFWNANGIRRQREELLPFLRQHHVDVLLVSETHLSPARAFTLPGFAISRTDRADRRGGGVLVAVRRGLPHYFLPSPATTLLELAGVVLVTSTGPLGLLAAYRPPDEPLVAADFAAMATFHSPFIAAGDFNAKNSAWGCVAENAAGRALLDLTALHRLEVLAPDGPTNFPGGRYRPDILDIAILKNVTFLTSIDNLSALDSNHDPVLLTLRTSAPDPALVPPPMDATTNWPVFRAHLTFYASPRLPLATTAQIDDAITHLTSVVREAKSLATTRTPRASFRPVIPVELQRQIALKNVVRRRWQNYRDPEDKRYLNFLVREVRAALLDHRVRRWDDTLSTVREDDGGLWKLTGRRLRSPSSIHAIQGPQELVFSPEAMAEALATSLEDRFVSPANGGMPPHVLRDIEAEAAALLHGPPAGPVLLTSSRVVRRLLRKMPAKKSPGPDGIGPAFLSALPPKAFALLLRIFNACLLLQYFPSAWKEAKVITILKPGKDKLLPQNYRPISLLNTMGKLFERVLLQRVQDVLLNHHTLRAEQFGFAPRCSATLQVLRLTEYVTRNFNRRRSTVAVFFDVQQAFDCVWHAGLLHKLRHFTPLDEPTVRLLASFLQGRTFRVALPSFLSTLRQASAGVPQGAVLSPLLFNVFINDLPVSPPCELALFADDTAFYCAARSLRTAHRAVQENIFDLSAWCLTWRLTLNAAKTQAIIFSRRRPPLPENITLNHTVLPWKHVISYLGVQMDRKLLWTHHTDGIVRRVKFRIHSLVPFFLSRTLPVRLKLLLYRAYVLPVMTYACVVWGNTAQHNLSRIQVLQNNVLRMISGRPRHARIRDLHTDHNVFPLRAQFKRVAARVYERLLAPADVPGAQLAQLGNYDVRPQWRYKTPKTLLAMPDEW